jgi:hypothetical protein
VVTVTSVVHAGSAGDVTVMDVADTTLKEVAAVEPNLTAVAPVRFVPVTVTEVPVGPEGGLTEVTTGALV